VFFLICLKSRQIGLPLPGPILSQLALSSPRRRREKLIKNFPYPNPPLPQGQQPHHGLIPFTLSGDHRVAASFTVRKVLCLVLSLFFFFAPTFFLNPRVQRVGLFSPLGSLFTACPPPFLHFCLPNSKPVCLGSPRVKLEVFTRFLNEVWCPLSTVVTFHASKVPPFALLSFYHPT